MKNSFQYSSLLCLLSLVCLLGCDSGGLAQVSGVVTVNGKPTANVRVVFAPMATKETNAPGPPSLGVTDEEGRYELKTREGSSGAVIGQHKVSFTYDDLEHLEDLNSWLSNAESKEDAAEAKKRISFVRKEISIRGAISKSSNQMFSVSSSGESDADFEIGDKKKK